jgi:hypothetical protein
MAKNWKLGVVGAALTLAACSSSRMVQVPPRVDLTAMGTIGMVGFRAPQGSDELSSETNRLFLTEIQAAQPGVPVLELSDEARVLDGASAGMLNAEFVRAIGEKHQVDALLFGVLDAKQVKPKVAIGGLLESLNAKAEIEGTLTAKMYDTRTGATLWTRTVADKRTIAALSVSSGGLSGGGTADADGARSELFQALVIQATDDFRPSWARVEE